MGGNPVVLATGQAKPWRIAVDGQYVYFTNQLGAVMRMSKTGGDAAAFAAGNQPWGIALDNDYVYYANHGTSEILRASKASGAPGIVAALDAPPTELIFDGTVLDFVTDKRLSTTVIWNMAWVVVGGGTVHWFESDNPSGCLSCCIAPRTIAGDNDAVYWPCRSNTGGIISSLKTGTNDRRYLIGGNPGTYSVFFGGVHRAPGELYYSEAAMITGIVTCEGRSSFPVARSEQVLADATSVYSRTAVDPNTMSPQAIYRMPK